MCIKKSRALKYKRSRLFWWRQQNSNLRPLACQASTLTNWAMPPWHEHMISQTRCFVKSFLRAKSYAFLNVFLKKKILLTIRRFFAIISIVGGCGGIGRRVRFRILCLFVQVQVLSPAPYRVFLTSLRVGWGHSIFFAYFAPLCMYELRLYCSFLLCR